jgi:hypothetical protein
VDNIEKQIKDEISAWVFMSFSKGGKNEKNSNYSILLYCLDFCFCSG